MAVCIGKNLVNGHGPTVDHVGRAEESRIDATPAHLWISLTDMCVNSKAKAYFGFMAKTWFEDALRKTMDWYRNRW